MLLTHLGPYRIDKPLGKGGMGSVYAATDPQTGQRVAIKALTPHLAMAEGFRERFEAEIESLKTLRHEGIVRLFGYGEQDGVLFYSMELVDGSSLEDELRAGRRFNWREVTNIGIQLALALKHAHDHGIVHRDIKPANILLFEEDRVKLADFGIARLFGGTQLTTAGGVLGTADYMSPEQAEGRPITPRCDQYSLGGVMYALLAARPPFVAKNLPQMLQLQRFAKPEPVRRYASDAPEQLEQIIMQLLAKDPADRFPNTQVLARHLQAMALALSPASDDFALAGELPAIAGSGGASDRVLADLANSLAAKPTRPDAPAADDPEKHSPLSPRRTPAATHEAATLAAEVLTPGGSVVIDARPRPAISGRGPTLRAAPAERPSHFTTVEEEAHRRHAENRRSWHVMAVQLAALISVLAAIAAATAFITRSPSADSLYRKITTAATSEDDTALMGAADDLQTFLAQYPRDPRADEVRELKTRLDLDKLERKLQRQARAGSFDTLTPIEQLYLRAVALGQESPDAAITMLQSLVDLYGPETVGGSDEYALSIVQLAQRRLAGLNADVEKNRRRVLDSLRERLDVAAKLERSDPRIAAAMYRAIIDLHQNDAWASDVVTQARMRLAELKTSNP